MPLRDAWRQVATPRAADGARPTDDIPKAILAMVAATLFITVSSALTKYEVARHPVGQVMFLRSAASLLVVATFLLPGAGLGVLRTAMPAAHVARGLSQSISQTFTVLALWLMPIAGATAINFTAPIWSALVSILWLKERLSGARAAFLLIGFLGVVVVVRPGADTLQLGALYALANAVMYGSVTVAVRGMSKTESANTLLMWQVLTVAGFHALLLPFGFDLLSGLDVAIMALMGVSNAAGQWFWTRALRLGPATAVSPFYYLNLVWAVLIGYAAWGDVPTVGLVVGSLIVVASGLALLWSETQARDRAAAATSQTSEPRRV